MKAIRTLVQGARDVNITGSVYGGQVTPCIKLANEQKAAKTGVGMRGP